jgi:hypothetical protein
MVISKLAVQSGFVVLSDVTIANWKWKVKQANMVCCHHVFDTYLKTEF